MSEDFPADIRQFIEQHIESLAQLEALLLLRKDPQHEWEAAEVAKTLYVPPEMAETMLKEFTNRGFAAAAPPTDSRYCYRISDDATDKLIEQLAAVYRDRRVAVISLIYSKPLRKVQTFADAFRLRKET
jgi:hypothetical protein